MAQKITFKKRPFKYVKDKHPNHFEAVKFIYYVYKDGVIDKFNFLLEKHFPLDRFYYHLYSNGDYVSPADKPGAAYNTEEINLAKMAMVQHVNGLPVTAPWQSFSQRMQEELEYDIEGFEVINDN